MLITDFSSLAFDFGYMKKHVIYYQYDEDQYFKSHYIKGYFDYRNDGFGPVYKELKDVVNYVDSCFKHGGELMKRKYLCNVSRFFPVYDNNNCERIFDVIRKM